MDGKHSKHFSYVPAMEGRKQHGSAPPYCFSTLPSHEIAVAPWRLSGANFTRTPFCEWEIPIRRWCRPQRHHWRHRTDCRNCRRCCRRPLSSPVQLRVFLHATRCPGRTGAPRLEQWLATRANRRGSRPGIPRDEGSVPPPLSVNRISAASTVPGRHLP